MLNVSRPQPEVLQEGREEHERKETENDRRDARQNLERRLDDLAYAGSRVLAQIDGGSEPERDEDEGGPERQRECRDNERKDAERSRSEQWRPASPGDEVDEVDLAEELDRRLEEGDDDPDRCDDRHRRADEQEKLDAVLAPSPSLCVKTRSLTLELEISGAHSAVAGGVAGAGITNSPAADSKMSRASCRWSSDSGTNSATSAISGAFSR